MKPGYRHFGTTADTGVRSFGRDIGEAFAEQAAGMFAIMTDLRGVRPRVMFSVDAAAGSGDDPVGMLAAWLEELLYISDVEGVFLRRFVVDRAGGGRVVGRAWGEEIDPARHIIKAQVKAVTHHRMSVGRVGGGIRTVVIYDI